MTERHFSLESIHRRGFVWSEPDRPDKSFSKELPAVLRMRGEHRTVNRRREFFRATPLEVKEHLAVLAGELLQYQDVPDAPEYRQCIAQQPTAASV